MENGRGDVVTALPWCYVAFAFALRLRLRLRLRCVCVCVVVLWWLRVVGWLVGYRVRSFVVRRSSFVLCVANKIAQEVTASQRSGLPHILHIPPHSLTFLYIDTTPSLYLPLPTFPESG